MGWSLFEGGSLQHTNGSQITLVSGTWQNPLEINPKMPDCLNAVEQAKLIRQGLIYARQQSQNKVTEDSKR